MPGLDWYSSPGGPSQAAYQGFLSHIDLHSDNHGVAAGVLVLWLIRNYTEKEEPSTQKSAYITRC